MYPFVAVVFLSCLIIRVSEGYTPTVYTAAGGSYGTTDGYTTSASFMEVAGMCYDSQISVTYVVDRGAGQLRQINASGYVSSVTGTGAYYNPSGCTVDDGGNIYVYDNIKDSRTQR